MADRVIQLNTGATMPGLAFGFWELNAEECAAGLEGAIDAGYRLLDFAHVYGNEKACGVTTYGCYACADLPAACPDC